MKALPRPGLDSVNDVAFLNLIFILFLRPPRASVIDPYARHRQPLRQLVSPLITGRSRPIKCFAVCLAAADRFLTGALSRIDSRRSWAIYEGGRFVYGSGEAGSYSGDMDVDVFAVSLLQTLSSARL